MAVKAVQLPDGSRLLYIRPGVWQREDPDWLKKPEQAYGLVPLVFRAVMLRCNGLVRVPWHLHDRRGNEVDWPWPDVPLERLLWQAEFDMLIFGATYWLKIQMRSGRIETFQRLHPDTMEVRVLETEDWRKRYVLEQHVDGRTYGPWQPEQVFHMFEPNPESDYDPGPSAAQVALGDIRLLWALTEYAATYFESGGMPVTTIVVPTNTPEPERQRVENWFRRLTQGVRRAWRVLAVRSGTLEAKTFQPELRNLVIPDLHEQARRDVALAFGIPQTLLEDAANYATAREHRKSFYDETILPRLALFEAELNRQVLNPLGLDLRFAPEEMDMYQEDENRRAGALVALTRAGMPLGLALQVLGYELPEGWDVDEAGNLVRIGPTPTRTFVGDNKKHAHLADPRATLEDLDRWERKVLKRVKAGKAPADVTFESEALGPVLMEAVRGALEACQDAAQVKTVFTMTRAGIQEMAKALDPDPFERRLARKLGRLEFEWFQKLRDLLGSPPHLTNVPESYWEDFAQALNQAMTEVLVDYMLQAARDWMQDTPLGLLWDEIVQDLNRWSRDVITDWAKRIMENTKRTVETVISDLLVTGWDEQEFLRRLALRYGPVHAELTAITEVTRAHSAVARFLQNNLAKQGIRTVRRWLTAEDERVCPVCRPLDHTTRESGAWQAAGYPEGPPAHPRCRCRVAVELTRRQKDGGGSQTS